MRIFLSVLFAHFALLLLGIIFSSGRMEKDLPQKISVQTFTAPLVVEPKTFVQKKIPEPSAPIAEAPPIEEPEPPVIASVEKTLSVKKADAKPTSAKAPPIIEQEPPSKKTLSVKKADAKPPSAKTPPTSAPKAVAKKTGENQKLLNMMQASLSKIDSASAPKKGSKKPSASPSEEVSYRDELVALLKLCLRLPETGEVRLKVTIDRTGHFKNMDVLEAESKKNRLYVETALPALALPPFGKAFQKEKEHTFSLTLQSQD